MTTQPTPTASRSARLSHALQSIGIAAAVAIVATGCASRGFVRSSAADERLETTRQIEASQQEVMGEVEEVQSQVDRQGQRIDGLARRTEELSKTAQEALQRAQEAGKLAQGQFVSETLLTQDALTFGLEDATIDEKGKQALAEFAEQLYAENENVFIEIQGHTDSSGDPAYNRKLGLERAEAVRLHLRAEHQVPLHRMQVISYGETSPIAPNDTREGRRQNRRVSLVVLK